ncbi:MAG TPA: heavy metal-associated domain-containing protein [Planctomycetota bacterium]
MKEKVAAALSFLASAVLSFCCTLPLALASLGLGFAGLGSVLKPARPYMLAVGALSLAYGLVTVHLKGRSRANKILLWSAAAVFVLAAGTPYAVGWFRGVYDPPPEIEMEPDARKVLIHLDGADCPAGCDGRALEALDALPGVRRVYIDHARSEAILIAGPDAEVDDASIERALRAAACKGHLKR